MTSPLARATLNYSAINASICKSMKPSARSQPLLLFIAYLGFISLGLPDTLIGVAWPSVRSHFDLPQSDVALIFFGSGFSYFFSSFFSGRFLKVFPIGKSTWWAKVKAGEYPQPVKLGPRTTAWRVEDIRQLLEKVRQTSPAA